jgi:trigger factor
LEKKINEINGCEKEIEITMTQDELQPHYDAAYREVQPTLNIRGFRKGKVPISMVKKMYGAQIEADALEKISNDVFNEVVKEQELKVVGNPSVKDIKKEDNSMTFVIAFECIPEIELGDYKSLVVDEPIHPVTDEEIDLELDRLLKANGPMAAADEVTGDLNVVGVNLREYDENGEIDTEKDPQKTHIYVSEPSVLPALKEELIGKKIMDKFDFYPKESDPSAPDKKYELEIFEIQLIEPAVFDDEFVKKYTQDKFESAEDYREEIGFKIQENWDVKSRQALEDQIVNQIVEAHEFDLPSSVVNEVINSMAEDIKKRYANAPQAASLSVDQMAPGLKPLAERTVMWEIIRNNIIEVEKLEVEDHDIDQLAEIEAARMNTDKEMVKKIIMQNHNMVSNIISKKVMDLLVDFTTTNEVTFEEFEEKTKAEDIEELENSDNELMDKE